jgi:hypothetical protein
MDAPAISGPRHNAMKKLLFSLAAALCAAVAPAHAAPPEKPKLTIAVGGKATLFYLPLTLAERLGYFRDEGLDVEIADLAGGAKSLQAMINRVWFQRFRVCSSCVPAGESARLRGQDATPAIARNVQSADRLVPLAGRPQGHEDRRHGAGFEHPCFREPSARRGRTVAG